MTSELRFINAPAIAPPRGHFSHAVRASETVYVSGLLGLDDDGHVVEGGIGAQTTRIFENLREILDAAGSSLDRVVKLTTYVRDIGLRGEVNRLRSEWFQVTRPASTLVEVGELAAPDALIEIDAIAVDKPLGSADVDQSTGRRP